MPSMVRKAHYKSRNGCLACKKRHVKCSESKPVCAHCTRLGIECLWPEGNGLSANSAPQSHSPASAPSYSTPSHSSSLAASHTASNGAQRMQSQPDLAIHDLKLLHFYLVNTSSSIIVDSAYMWQNVVVELGFRHHFLLHGILAVAAIHKASIYPSEQDELLVQSAAHIEIGLRTFRKCLESPLPATCVPVFLMAGLLSVQSLGTAQIHTPVDPIGDLCMWMRMVKGTKSTIHQNWLILRSSEIASMLHGLDLRPDETTHVVEISDLKSLVEQTSAHGTSARDVYLDCVAKLRTVLVNIRRPDCSEKLASTLPSFWAATVNEEYCELLARRDPLALVIVTYFTSLFRHSSNSWWYLGWHGWVLNAVQSELSAEYEPWLEWPKMQLSSTASTPAPISG